MTGVHQFGHRPFLGQCLAGAVQQFQRVIQRRQQLVCVGPHIARTRSGAVPATRVPSRNDPAANANASGTSPALAASASASRCGRCEMAAAAASCSFDFAGTTTEPQSSASCITCAQMVASTCSSTLTTQGAPRNNPASPATQPE